MDLKIIPTIELLNCQDALQKNINFNRGLLNDLTKAKGILKSYDSDNQRQDALLARLDKDQKVFNKIVRELNDRCEKTLDMNMEFKKFDDMQKEISGKFAEATALYLKSLPGKMAENQNGENPDENKGVVDFQPAGQA